MRKKEYLFLIFITLILTLIFVLPHILIPKLLGDKPYYPLVLDGAPIFTTDELTWPAAEAREVMDGRLFPTDPLVFEHKEAPSMTAQLPVIVIGLLGRVTGSINNAYLVLGFILSPLVFLSIFILAFLLTKEYLVSSLISVLIMTTTRPFQFIPPLNLEMVKAIFGYLTNRHIEPAPLEFFRLPNPLLIFPFFILAIIFLYLTLERKKTIFALVGGIFFGLLFYIYFYFWTFILCGAGIFLIVNLVRRKQQEVKLLLIFFSSGAIVSLFYWFNFLKFWQYPFKNDILSRAGIEIGRIKNLSRTVQFLLFALLFSLLIKKKDSKFLFLLALLLAGIVCLNLQLATGYSFQSNHWTLRVINPWTMLMLGFVYFRLFCKKNFYNPLTLFLIFVFLGLGFWTQFSFSQQAYSVYTLAEEKTEALRWLDKNTPKDSVIGALSLETNSLIPVYTHNNVFLANGGATLASTKEIIKRIFYIYKLFELEPQYLNSILTYQEQQEREKEKNCLQDQCLKNRRLDFVEREAIMTFFHMQYATFAESLGGWSYRIVLPAAKKEEIVWDYKKFLESNDYLPKTLRLDYVFFGPEEKKLTRVYLGKYDFLSLVYQKEGIEIYEVKNLDSLK